MGEMVKFKANVTRGDGYPGHTCQRQGSRPLS